MTLFRSAEPEDVARLAGARWVNDMTWEVKDGQPTGRSATTMRARPRLDSDHVRAYQPGEAAIIEGGRVEHVRIIRTSPDPKIIQRGHELVSRAHGSTNAKPLEGPDNAPHGLEPQSRQP